MTVLTGERAQAARQAQNFVVVVFDGVSLGIMSFAFGVFDMAKHYGVLPDLELRVVAGEPAQLRPAIPRDHRDRGADLADPPARAARSAVARSHQAAGRGGGPPVRVLLGRRLAPALQAGHRDRPGHLP
jgi:hypothetical protein